MEGQISNSENDVVGPELKKPELNITVAHGPDHHQVSVPSDSTFGITVTIIDILRFSASNGYGANSCDGCFYPAAVIFQLLLFLCFCFFACCSLEVLLHIFDGFEFWSLPYYKGGIFQ